MPWVGLAVPVIAAISIAWTPRAASASTDTATVTVLHGLPGFTADVYVNGKLTLDGFKPKTATEPLSLPAGTYDIAIRNVGASPDTAPVLHATVHVKGGVNYTLAAHLDDSGEPTVTAFANPVTPVPAGRSRMLVRDVAHADGLVVRVDGDPRFTHFNAGSSPSVLFDPGRHSIDATTAASPQAAIPQRPLTLGEGDETIVYVVGSEADRSLDFMVQVLPLSSAPAGIPSGDGGLAAPRGLPVWVKVSMGLGLCIAIVSALRLLRARGRFEPRPLGEAP
jgi:hypothetical protein